MNDLARALGLGNAAQNSLSGQSLIGQYYDPYDAQRQQQAAHEAAVQRKTWLEAQEKQQQAILLLTGEDE